MLHTRIGRSVLNDVWQIEVNALMVGYLETIILNVAPVPTADIHQCF